MDFNFVDIHYHANPDLYHRELNALSAGRKYQSLKGAVFLKSHLGATSIQATLAQNHGLPVFPSVVLNRIAGGIHYRTVLRALCEYQPVIPSKLLVHFPTITGRKHQSKLKRTFSNNLPEKKILQPETLFNEKNLLKSEVIDILKMANDYPIVLSSGHSSKEETYALVEACERYQIKTLLLNQPANPMTGLSAKELLELSALPFLWIEQTTLTYLLSYQTEEDFKAVVSLLPRVIYSSDLGQTSQITIDEWLKVSEHWFSKFNLSSQKKAEICLSNPSQLLL